MHADVISLLLFTQVMGMCKFDTMWRKRAFVHWFVGCGIEDRTLEYARDDVLALEEEYRTYGQVDDDGEDDD